MSKANGIHPIIGKFYASRCTRKVTYSELEEKVMSDQSKPYRDLYTQVAEEFNVERAFVKVVAMEVMYGSPNQADRDIPLIDKVRAKVKQALELIDKSEES